MKVVGSARGAQVGGAAWAVTASILTLSSTRESTFRDREIATFVVATANGSGLRGATEQEVHESGNLLMSAIE